MPHFKVCGKCLRFFVGDTEWGVIGQVEIHSCLTTTKTMTPQQEARWIEEMAGVL